MKKILLVILGICGLGLFTTPVMAVDKWDKVCSDTSASAAVKEAAGCNDVNETKETLMKNNVAPILDVFIGIVGVIAVIMIVVGGMNYATSNGDPVKATKARNTIIFSVVGLVIAILAFAIVNFAVNQVF